MHLRATLKKDQTQATKIKKFFRASVFGTKPRIPTTSMVEVHTIAAMMTMRRRPNLSVNVIRQIEVTSAMTAGLVSSKPPRVRDQTYSVSL